jgi:flagellar hook-associated protein 1 FlgK
MGLDAALGISVSGLRAINQQLRVVSNNISNAEVPGYTAKTLPTTSVVAAGKGIGVATQPAQRATEAALQRAIWQREAGVAAAQVRISVLAPLEALHGKPENGDSLAGLTGRVRDSFIALAAQPSSTSLQVEIVDAAAALANKLNVLSGAVTDARNRSQQMLVDGVAEANRLLGEAGSLTREIVRLKAEGQSTAELEDKRDMVIGRLAGLMDLRVVLSEKGTMTAFTRGGQTVPLRDGALAVNGASLAPQSFYEPGGGTVPPVLLIDSADPANPVDLTRGQLGGELGALIGLRDETLPRMQAELDEFAHKLARRFDQQGLRLFTDARGNVPQEQIGGGQNGYVGFAAEIRIFAAVVENPSLVRDGTHGVPGGLPPWPATREVQAPYGDPFTPNPSGGPASFDLLVNRILEFTFGSQLGIGRPHDPPLLTTGLGPRRDLTSPIASTGTLADFAAGLVSAQTAEHAAAKATAESLASTRDLLANRYADAVGVNLDKEMALLIQLQNAYAANARVITASQAMWDALLAAVR